MEIQDFIQKIADLFEETDRNIFTPETEFQTLEEWSSLMSLSVIAMVDEEYDVKVKGDDIKTANTIEDLFNIVKSRM